MKVEDLKSLCLGLPGTVEDLKWGNDLCFCVGSKMYAVLSLDASARLSFKVDRELFDHLTQLPEVVPAPYLARYHWICLESLDALAEEQIAGLVKNSYQMIHDKLPKKIRQKIADSAE